MRYLQHLRALGFDDSAHIPFTKQYKAKCSKCESLVVNNTPTHEQGCPNQTFECRGCSTLVARGQRYCKECVS